MKYLMKSCIVLALLLVLTVSCAPTPATPAAPAQTEPEPEPSATDVPVQAEENTLWEAVLETEVDQSMRIAAFLDQNFGLTGGAGSPGRAQLTNDGETWTLAESSLG